MCDVPPRDPGRARGLHGMCLQVGDRSSAFASRLRLLISFLLGYVGGDKMSLQRGAPWLCLQQLRSWRGSDGYVSPTSWVLPLVQAVLLQQR